MIGAVAFDVGGRAYSLRFGNAALCAIEERMGKGVADVLDMAGNPATSNVALRTLVWAGLGGSMTLQDVSELIDQMGRAEAERVVGEALMAAFPQRSAEGNGEAKA